MLAADNVLPVLTTELQTAYGDELSAVLNDVSSKLTTAGLTEMNKRFDIDKEDAEAIAADWLADNGF
jgi:osmoprotectant transport system substrate-binding protein